ncbi:hypothetical protein [Saccharopolyspora karakumensis]|uniref:hypothetical protein n=1 Tax=Saccharopolyspora karakumensis TaxID=2530386 RepID=UPI001A9F4706|nr:hypothetical protein [Saccharopolyspora karakumensis]
MGEAGDVVTVATRLDSLERALRAAPAHELPETLLELLGKQFGVAGLETYLADLRLAVLEPVIEPEGPGIRWWRRWKGASSATRCASSSRSTTRSRWSCR